jgi:hypothetical protein
MAYDKSHYGPKLKVKVTNSIGGRVDYHEGLTKFDIDWIKSNPNLQVEVLEVRNGRRRQLKR